MKPWIYAPLLLSALLCLRCPAKPSPRDAGEDRDAFALKVLAEFQKRMPDAGFRYEPEQFRIVGRQTYWNLDNHYDEYLHGDATPEQLAARGLDVLQEAERPGELLPALRARYFLEASAKLGRAVDPDGGVEPSIPYEPVADFLALTVVDDHPSAMRYFSTQDVAKFDGGFPAALEQARANLARSHPRATLEPVRPGVYRVRSEDEAYATTSFFVGQLFRSVKLKGDPVAVPVSNVATFVTGADDEKGLEFIAERAKEEAEKPRSWGPFAVRWTGSTWVPFSPPPGTDVGAEYALMRVRFGAVGYSTQRAMLLERHAAEGASPAEFHATRNTLSGAVTTYAALVSGVDTLLPEVDQVRLMKDEHTSLGLVPWARFAHVMRSKMERTALWPPLYRVRQFPTAAELKRLDPKPP